MVAKQIQSEQTKEKILFAGFEVLKTQGVKHLTAGQITKVAEISKGGFFHHFPTIEDFYIYMLKYMIQFVEQQITEQKPNTMREFMERSTETMFQIMDHAPETMTVISYFIDLARFNESYAQVLKELLQSSLDKWVVDLSEYFPPDLSTERKTTIVTLIDIYFGGLGNHYLMLKDKEQYQKITTEFIGMIENYIAGS